MLHTVIVDQSDFIVAHEPVNVSGASMGTVERSLSYILASVSVFRNHRAAKGFHVLHDLEEGQHVS